MYEFVYSMLIEKNTNYVYLIDVHQNSKDPGITNCNNCQFQIQSKFTD